MQQAGSTSSGTPDSDMMKLSIVLVIVIQSGLLATEAAPVNVTGRDGGGPVMCNPKASPPQLCPGGKTVRG